MIQQICLSIDQLQQILRTDEHSPVATHWESHLAECSACQCRLDALAASADEWREATAQLSSAEIDPRANSLVPLAETAAGFANSQPLPSASRAWSAVLSAPSHPELLGRVGRYEVESVLGHGGFGVVFKGRDGDLNRPVAIKVLAPHLANHGAARKRFVREAQAAAAINHPNVVPIYAVDASAEFPYLVMSYVPGHSLQEIVDRDGPMDAKSIVRIGTQIAAGLDAAHRQGLVHRDVKPANILLENDLHRALVTDFGLARAADDAALTRSGWLAGTPHYMSPEQAQGKDVDARSDVFSLGSVLYFLATGREPFRAEQPLGVLQKIINSRPLSPRAINPDIPLALSRFIEQLLEKRPGSRLPSAAAVSQWLERYLAYLQRPQDFPEPRVAGRFKRARRVAGIACGVAVVVLALTASLWTWYPSKAPENHEAVTHAPPLVNPALQAATRSAQQAVEAWEWQVFSDEFRSLDSAVGRLEFSFSSPPEAGLNYSWQLVWPDETKMSWESEVDDLLKQIGNLESNWEF